MLRARLGSPAAPSGQRIGLFGVLGSGNIGNDASLEAIVGFLRERHPDADLSFLAMGPELLEDKYGAPADHLQWFEAHEAALACFPPVLLKVAGRLLDPLRTLLWTRRHDVVIVPGMGVLETTAPNRPWGLPYSLLCLAVAGRLCGTQVALVCVGADWVPNRLTRWLLTRAARLAHYRSYRDELSRSAMHRMGVDVRNDRVYPDLAFAIPAAQRAAAPERSVAVGLMNYRGADHERPRARELHAAYVGALTWFVGELAAEGWTVRLVGGDREDAPVLRQVRDATRGAHPTAAIAVEPAETFPELMNVFGEAEVVVATRYHNVIAALRMAVPTLSISYARKSDALMAAMGLGEFCQPAWDVEPHQLLEQVRKLHARRPELGTLLRDRNDELGAELAAQFDALSAFLRARGRTGTRTRTSRRTL